MNEVLIAARGLNVSVEGNAILEHIDLSISSREIVTLIGPNGSGKTTLLRALMGLMPANGEIRRRPGLKVGYVPQQFARDPSLPITVQGFLKLFAPLEAGLAALQRTGIAAARGKAMSALSGGELARVLLARAIAGKPDLLALDEPTASVDVAGEAALYHLIGEIRDELGCGVLLISHDLHVVMAKATHVVCLNRHICCQGEASAVVQDPAFLQLFGAKAAADMAFYAHHHHHTHTLAGDPVPGEE
jgi:zinc transport system ATP-binding protein